MHPILVSTHLKRIRDEVFQGGSICLALTFSLMYGLTTVLLIAFHTVISIARSDAPHFNCMALGHAMTEDFFPLCLSAMSLVYLIGRGSQFGQSVTHFARVIPRCMFSAQV